MEDYQKSYIASNFDQLIELTRCQTSFLAHLVANGVLGFDDLEMLEFIQLPSARASKFYSIILTRTNSYEKVLEALKNTKQTGAAQLLEKISFPSTSTTKNFKQNSSKTNEVANKPILFDVRAPVRLFTGREQEVSDLHERILNTNNQNAIVISQMASVTGLGGIGKTELCRKYIQQHHQDYDGNVIWINTEKEELIAESFKRLAKDILRIPTKDINGEDKNIKSIVGEVYAYFQGRKCLFVFDNAESGSHLLTYLPQGVDEVFILITSRDREWKFSVTMLELDVLSELDAINFVKKGLCINDDSQNEDIIKLVNKLQNFPLALQQAISFINQRSQVAKYNIPKYLKAYELNTEIVLNSRIPTVELNDYTKKTFTAWKMTTISISLEPKYGPLAIKILHLLSYCDADNIPQHLLSSLSTTEEEDSWLWALQLLVRYSMINIQTEQELITIHRLVQEVTRIELERQNNDVPVIKELMEILQSNLDVRSVNHAVSAFYHACKHPQIMNGFDELPSKVVDELRINQRLHDAKKFGQKALRLLQPPFSLVDPIVIRLEYRTAQVDVCLHNYREALTVFKTSLQNYKKYCNPFLCEEVLCREYSVAEALCEVEESQGALQILQQVNKHRKLMFGTTAWRVVNQLASIYSDMHQYDVALQMYEEALSLCKNSDKEPNPAKNALMLSQNVAHIYQKTGRVDHAISLLKDIYSTVEKSDDIDSTVVGQNLAVSLCAGGYYNEAKNIAKEVHEKQKKFYGPTNIATLHTLAILARLKCCEGKFDDALSDFNEILEQFKNRLGESHKRTLALQCDVSNTFLMAGMKEKALEIAKDILKRQKALRRPEADDAYTTQCFIAGILESMQRYEESLYLLKQTKKSVKDIHGGNTFPVLRIKEQIGRLKEKMSNAEIL